MKLILHKTLFEEKEFEIGTTALYSYDKAGAVEFAKIPIKICKKISNHSYDVEVLDPKGSKYFMGDHFVANAMYINRKK